MQYVKEKQRQKQQNNHTAQSGGFYVGLWEFFDKIIRILKGKGRWIFIYLTIRLHVADFELGLIFIVMVSTSGCFTGG